MAEISEMLSELMMQEKQLNMQRLNFLKVYSRENVTRPMELGLLAPRWIVWNKTYFCFLTGLFFGRVGKRPKINPEKFLIGIRPNCNIVTSELDLHHFYSRSNSQHKKLW